MKTELFLLFFGLVMIIPEGEVQGQILFQERISLTNTNRVAISRADGEVLFEEAGPGHPDLGQPTFSIAIVHRLGLIEPALDPTGEVESVRLSLIFLRPGEDNYELQVYSLRLDLPSEQSYSVGDSVTGSIELKQNPVADGELRIEISGAEPLTLLSSTLTIEYTPAVEAGADGRSLPENYALEGNYPNPFNPTTRILFVLPVVARVTLEVFNVNGQHVKTLTRSTMLPGRHTIEWNGTDSHGHQVVSGLYLYRLQAGKFIDTRKMILIK